MNAYAWSSFITFVSVFFIGIGVFLYFPAGRINRRFALFSAAVAVWASGRVLYLTTASHEDALFWARFTIAGAVFIPTSFLYFVSEFLRVKAGGSLLFSGTVSLILFLLNLTPWMVKDVAPKYHSAYFIEPGPLYPFFAAFFIFGLLLSFSLLRKRYRVASDLERNRIRFLSWSTLIGFLGGVSNFLPDFNLEMDSFSAYATYLGPVYVTILTYAIVRHHLLDIEIVIQKGVVYLLAVLATGIPFFLLMLFFQAVLPLRLANIASFFLFMAVLLIFSNIKPLTQRWVERSLFHERYRHFKSIHEFSGSIVRFLHLEDLTENIFTVLTKTLHPRSISIFLMDQRGHYYLHRTFGHEPGEIDLLFPSDHPLLIKLKEQKKILTRDEAERSKEMEIVRQMEDLHSDLCLPLIFEGRLIGVCHLGPKESGRAYTRSELFMLETLSANASIAFENARLYKEVSQYIERFAVVGRAINLSPDVDQIFDLLLKEIQKYINFDWAALAIYNPEGEIYFYRVKGKEEAAPLPQDYTWPVTDSNRISRLKTQQEPILQADLLDPDVPEREKKLFKKGVRSYAIFPLWVSGKFIGTINLWSASPMPHRAQIFELIGPLVHHFAPFLEVSRFFQELKAANDALKQKSLELEASQRNQARFFSFVTHELRTPLNAILGYLSLTLDGSYGNLDPKVVLALNRAKENSLVLKQLINDLLDLARLETAHIAIEPEEIDLTNFLGRLLEEMESLMTQKNIQVELTIQPPGSIYTDRSKFRQVIENILSNAVKFTENGTIRIKGRCLPEKEAIEVEISDTGKGISKEDLPHIFEPFWQKKSEDAKNDGGSGLGLTIVKRTTDVLKGEIGVSSCPGVGTTFTLIFPRQFPQDQRKTA